MADSDTTASTRLSDNTTKLTEILADVNRKSLALIERFIEKKQINGVIDQVEADAVGKSFQRLAEKLMADPTRLFNDQMTYWQEYWTLVQQSALQFWGQPALAVIEPEKGDRRFSSADWDDNPVFSFIKQSYLLTARAIRDAVGNVQGLDDETRRKVSFYTDQYLDAMAPTNFLATNPELIKLTMETRGENLLNGLNNLLDDLDRGPCQLQIRMTDMNAFEVGKDLAITKGKVVYNNDLMELIQYSPTTDQVYRRPLLFVPPWINKFYILDLKPANSMVKWMVDQGYTVFMISWANPDEALKEKSFDDYMRQGPIDALKQIEQITGQRQVNTIGYCMGGTLLACANAWLAAADEGDRIASSTYMASLMDFSDPGDIGVFIDEEQVSAFETRMNSQGYLDGCAMSNSFSMLRANDLVWSYVINNYLKGAAPIAFDILFWNSDSTNMPARMHSYYLRNMYLHNRLRQPGGISLDGEPIDLRRISSPAYFISTREDHIAGWQATYAGARLLSGKVRFVLGASGHVAGIVNPPAKNKYGHWVNEDLPDTPDQWWAGSRFIQESWWLDWARWNRAYAGEQVPARPVVEPAGRPLDDAPGCYVTRRLDVPESGVCYMTSALV
jgi:polyhydroxyalkanoate synthase